MNVHVIEDCRQRVDECWLLCTCGVRLEANWPEELAERYAAHRKAVKATHQRPPRAKSQPIGRATPSEMWSTW